MTRKSAVRSNGRVPPAVATRLEVSDAILERAHAIGRRARARGVGVLEMAAVLHRAIEKVARAPARKLNGARSRAGIPGAPERVARRCLAAFQDPSPGPDRVDAFMRILNERREQDLRRIADRLHDSAFQLLSALRLELDRAVAGCGGDPARFDPVRARIGDVEAGLRGLAHELRPAALDDLGLVAALRLLARGQAGSNEIDIRVRGRMPRPLGKDVETVLYRVVQEAVANAVRHSKASSVDVVLGQVPGWALCRVADDGTGFDPTSADCRGGLGLIGMRERLIPLQGRLRIDSAPGRGTVVAADIPLQATNAASHPAG